MIPNEIHFMLRTIPPGHDLDQYVFSSAQHAVEWLQAQPAIEGVYKVLLVHLRQGKTVCPQCGARRVITSKIVRTVRAKDFVKEYGSG